MTPAVLLASFISLIHVAAPIFPNGSSATNQTDRIVATVNEFPENSIEDLDDLHLNFPIRSTTPRAPAHHVDVTSWPWFLILLTGNSTIAGQRQRDLATYLKLNLAARLDADYNDVVINRVLLTHGGIVANVSVEPGHLVGMGALGLQQLAKGNVTLLQLSGQEFLVKKILTPNDLETQRILQLEAETGDPELAIYGAVGAFLLFVFFMVLLGFIFHGPCKRYDKQGYDEPYDQQDEESISTEMKMINPMPPVIYTEDLAKEMSEGINLVHACANERHCEELRKMNFPRLALWNSPAFQCECKKSALLFFQPRKNIPHQQRRFSAAEDVQSILSNNTSTDPRDDENPYNSY